MRTYTKGANTPRYWTESRFCCHAAETAILEIYFGSLRTSISSYFCPVNPLLIQPSHSISWFPSLTTVLWTTKPRYIKLCDFDVYAAGMCQLSRFSKLPHFTTPRVAMASDSSLCQYFIKSQDPSVIHNVLSELPEGGWCRLQAAKKKSDSEKHSTITQWTGF